MIIKQYIITLPADFDMAIIQTDQADALDQLQSVTREESGLLPGPISLRCATGRSRTRD
jgi:hypothetical protein